MTAEDRAALVVQKWCEREWDAKAGVESIAAAIREAEDEALERAAMMFARLPPGPIDNAGKWAAHCLRVFKSGAGRGEQAGALGRMPK